MPDHYQRIAAAIHYLQENFKQRPTLAEIARHAGLSPYHLHRVFSNYTGISPKRFCQFLANTEAKKYLLSSEESLLATSEHLGLSNPSRLHNLLVSVDAVTPGEYRKRGQQLTIRYGIHVTPFGPCLLAITTRGICNLEFINGSHHQALERLRTDWPAANLHQDNYAGAKIIEQIFFTRPTDKPLPLYLKGTNFQLKVWQALLSIPEGTLASYSTLASLLGEEKACRAVGNAVGKNPIAYLIPCHRVLRSNGSVGGYRWGQERKMMILSRELVKD